jgi:hypothetical protein
METLSLNTSKKPNQTDVAQIDRFKEAARQLEADESEAAFDENLKAIAKQKPGTPNPSKKTKSDG